MLRKASSDTKGRVSMPNNIKPTSGDSNSNTTDENIYASVRTTL